MIGPSEPNERNGGWPGPFKILRPRCLRTSVLRRVVAAHHVSFRQVSGTGMGRVLALGRRSFQNHLHGLRC